jgi:hypothetical protein
MVPMEELGRSGYRNLMVELEQSGFHILKGWLALMEELGQSDYRILMVGLE